MLVGVSKVVSIKAVDAEIVLLNRVAKLAKYYVKRVSKLNMQRYSSSINRLLFATYILEYSSSCPPVKRNCLLKGLSSILLDSVL